MDPYAALSDPYVATYVSGYICCISEIFGAMPQNPKNQDDSYDIYKGIPEDFRKAFIKGFIKTFYFFINENRKLFK